MYYLSLNGISDYLKTPAITYTDIYLDMVPHNIATGTKYYIDARDSTHSSPYLFRNNGVDAFSGSTVYVNDVQYTTNNAFIQPDTRATIRIKKAGTIDQVSGIYFASRWSVESFMQMDIYDIKIYNGATLVAHYDMSTQTVNDQSGNGNNATLIGGTWAGGSSSTPISESASASGASSVTASPQLITSSSGTSSGKSTVTASPLLITSASGTSNGVSTVTATPTLQTQASATANGASTVSATPILPTLANATSSGASTVTANAGSAMTASATSNGVSQASAIVTQTTRETAQASGASAVTAVPILVFSASAQSSGLSSVTVVYSPPRHQVIHPIYLHGTMNDTVELTGAITDIVALKGCINETVQLKGVMI